MKHPDVCIAGAGIIGLTLALALTRRRLSVCVLSIADPMTEASTAAAGMLAVDDPANPPALHALAQFSRGLYPALLASLQGASAPSVDFQTHRTLQAISPTHPAWESTASPLHALLPTAKSDVPRFLTLEEESLDPRELAPALIAAVLDAQVQMHTGTPVLSLSETESSVLVRTATGTLETDHFVDCTGAWSLSSAQIPSLRVVPRKGQMLTVPTPAALAPGIVVRSHEIYLVPRIHGPSAGHTLIGATVENVGFDRSIDPRQLARLLQQAAALLPVLHDARIVTSWSGLRPATDDLLPAIGLLPGSNRLSIASGHFRNGILLAPGTAELLARQISGEAPSPLLTAFAPDRFATNTTNLTSP